MGDTLQLKAGEAITITAGVASTGTVRRVENPGGGVSYHPQDIAAGSTVVVGPFFTNRAYEIITTAGSPLSYSVAVAESGHTITGGSVGGMCATVATVGASESYSVPANTQAIVYDTLTVNGTVTVNGTLAVLAWPTS